MANAYMDSPTRKLRQPSILVVVLAGWLALIPNAYGQRSTDPTHPTGAVADTISTSGAINTETTPDVAAITTGTSSGAIDKTVAIDAGGTGSSRSPAASPVSNPLDNMSTGAGSGSKTGGLDATGTIDTMVGTPSGNADAEGGTTSAAIDDTTVIASEPP